MRKFIWGGAAACLVMGAFGVYLATSDRHVETVWPAPVEKEHEAPVALPNYSVDLVSRPPQVSEPEDAIEVFEPIVVEGPVADSLAPQEPQIGGATIVDHEVNVAAEIGRQPPRPDEEPGQERKMPYADQKPGRGWFGATLWGSLWRALTGSETVVHIETPEPPVFGNGTGMATQPQGEPPLAPAIDYHHHQQCCPYTGRCPLPYHPAPPVTGNR